MRPAPGKARLGAAILTVATVSLLVAPGTGYAQVLDRETYTYVALDELEYAPGPEMRPLVLDGVMWHGGDYNRLWVKAEGEQSTLEDAGEYEVQALYGAWW